MTIDPRNLLDPRRTHLDSLLDNAPYAGGGTGWVNPLTGYGTSRDKSTYGYFSGFSPTDLGTLSSLYHGSDLAARVIDVVPEEEFRLPFRVCIDEDDELTDQLNKKMTLLEAKVKMKEARIWGRLFGGSCLVIGADDGRGAHEPLDPKNVRTLDWLTVVDRRYLWPIQWYQTGPKAGEPELYTVSNTWTGVTTGSYILHESRMIRFPGARTAKREKMLNANWDYSIIDKVLPQIRMLETIYKGVEILVIDGPQGVYKVKGLMDQILAGNETAMVKRFELVDMFRSTLRAILIDADQESFERQQITYSGLPEILVQMQRRLSSAVQIPIMVLFGQSPVGLGQNNDNDIRWFYDLTVSSQNELLMPRILKVAEMALASLGRVDAVDKLRVKFEPLWSPTAKEIAEERESVSRTDKNYIDSGVLTPEEVALSRFQRGGEWSREWTGVDRETREAMLQDILSNLQKGSEPGIPGADMGRTPGVQDVRGGAPGQDPGDVADVTDQQKKPAKTPGTTDETAKGDTIRKDYSPDQPRAENGQFGEGSGSGSRGSADRGSIDSRAGEDLSETSEDIEDSGIAYDDQPILESAEEKYYELEQSEQNAIANFTQEDFGDIREAQVSGVDSRDASTIDRVASEAAAKAEPIQLYRGLTLSPEEADNLLSAESIALQGTASFSPVPKIALGFAAGKSQNEGKQDKSRIPVILSGRLRGLSIPKEATRYSERETIVPNQTLNIKDKAYYDHPRMGRILVLTVEEK